MNQFVPFHRKSIFICDGWLGFPRAARELEIPVPPILTKGSTLLFVEGVVTHLYAGGGERDEIVMFKGLRGQDLIAPKPRDDLLESVLEGWFVYHAVVPVQREQLLSSFKPLFR
jgi:hypothetical protein